MDKGIFGSMFDFDGDGRMDAFESAAELQFLHEVVFADDADDEPDSVGSDLSDFDDDL